MDKHWRSGAGLAGTAALVGGLLALAGYLGWIDMKSPAPHERGAPLAVATPSAQVPVAAGPAPVPAAPQAVALASTCPSEALASASADGDGRFDLQAALATGSRAEPSAFVVVAREAAQQGRVHDAEVALLAACHVAEEADGRASAPLADVKSQLGQHYVMLAAREEADDAREGLLQRASLLFADSAQAYAAALGRNASKTRMAEQRLASVREPQTLHAALDAQPPATGTLGAARMPERIAPVPELVQADPELSQLERDLERLRAQAASVSRDRAGMQRREAQALAQRDARCQDKACLLHWYAQRRAQLLGEF